LADIALLVLRVVLGLTYVAHGLRKLGVGGGEGFAGFRGSIARRGYRPAVAWASAAVLAEVVGGALVVAGLVTPIGAALLVGQSLTIVALVAPRGFWHNRGGIEYPVLLGTASLAVALTGPGALSLDTVLGIRPDPMLAAGAVAAAVVGALVGLALRRPVPA
jgi:putative oxidoreductase